MRRFFDSRLSGFLGTWLLAFGASGVAPVIVNNRRTTRKAQVIHAARCKSPAPAGEQDGRNKPVTFPLNGRIFSPFLDRTVAVRRHEKPAESATGIIPGNRGKEGGNWCRRPLCGASRRQANITSSSGRCRSRSSYATKELCDQARCQKPRPSRVRSKVSFGPCTDAVTQRVSVATV
jgi:hypothetical protein